MEIYRPTRPRHDLDLDFQDQSSKVSSRPIKQKKRDHRSITHRYGDICINSL